MTPELTAAPEKFYRIHEFNRGRQHHYGSYAMNSSYLGDWLWSDKNVGPGVIQDLGSADDPHGAKAEQKFSEPRPVPCGWPTVTRFYQFTAQGPFGGPGSGNAVPEQIGGGETPVGYHSFADGGYTVLGDNSFTSSTPQASLRLMGQSGLPPQWSGPVQRPLHGRSLQSSKVRRLPQSRERRRLHRGVHREQ